MNHTAPVSQRPIVIGGGLAGLAAATYLARGGAHVRLLEKAPSLGGRASTDTPHAFALNRGAHALYAGGPATAVLQELGVSFTSGSPRGYLARDERGLHPFPAAPMDMLRTTLLDATDKADLLRVFVLLATAQPRALSHTSTAAWLQQHVRRPRVRRLMDSLARVTLYSAGLDLASADVFVARFQSTLKNPVLYVEGGWQTLVDGLRDAAVAAGVEILTSASVAAIDVAQQSAVGVRLHDGRRFEATSIVLAATPEDVQHLLPDNVAPRLQRTLAQLVPAHIACLDVALTRLPEPRQAVIFDVEQPRFLSAQSRFAHLAPDGGAVIHTLRHLDPRDEGDPARERAQLEALLDQAQPGWRDLVVEQRFLPRMLAVSALPLAETGGLAGRPAVRCPDLDNVYFAGDWVGPEGFLADATLSSARAAARLTLADSALPVALAA